MLGNLAQNWRKWVVAGLLVTTPAQPSQIGLAQDATAVAGQVDQSRLILAGPTLVTAVAPSPTWPSDGRLMVALGDRVARTSDGGDTWDFLPAPGLVLSLTLAPSLGPAPIAFALASESLYRSADLGTTWTAVASRPDVVLPSPDFARDGLVFSLNSGALARSIDGGETWTAVRIGEEQSAQELVFSTSFPNDRKLFASVTGSDGTFEILVSTDGGTSWTSASTLLGQDDLHAEPGGMLELGAYTPDGVPVSDYLRTLDQVRFRVEALTMTPSYAEDGILFAAARGVDVLPRTMQCPEPRVGAVFRSTDRGATWELAGTAAQPVCPRAPEVTVSPTFAEDGMAFFRFTVAVTPFGTACRVYRSDDRGASWNPAGEIMGNRYGPENNRRGCLHSVTLMRVAGALSLQDGNSRSRLVEPLPVRLSLVPFGDQLLVLSPTRGSIGVGLHLSLDGGRSWQGSPYGAAAGGQDGSLLLGDREGVRILSGAAASNRPDTTIHGSLTLASQFTK